MRITESYMLSMSIDAMMEAQRNLSDDQEMLTSGRRVNKPSDDPVAWARARRARMLEIADDSRGKALDTSKERLAQVENTMGTLSQILTKVRELGLQGANDSLNSVDRGIIAQEVTQQFEAALAAANAIGNDGEFILAGTASDATPFDATGAYVGNTTTRSIEAYQGSNQVISIAGSQLTATNGIDVLPAISSLATALAANDSAAILTALGQVELGDEQVNRLWSEVGTFVNAIDTAQETREQNELRLVEAQSDAIDIDAIEAATALTKSTQAFEAAQLVSSRIIDLMRV